MSKFTRMVVYILILASALCAYLYLLSNQLSNIYKNIMPPINVSEEQMQRIYLYTAYPFYYRSLSKIIKCESGWNDEAISKTHDYGLLQINNCWLPKARAMNLDPVGNWKDNIDFGVYLVENGGATHWKASYNCHHVSKI